MGGRKSKGSKVDALAHKCDQYGSVVPQRPDGAYEGIAFAFPDSKTAAAAFEGRVRRYMYHGTNEGNPTVRTYEKMIARGESRYLSSASYDALATASGMSAIDLLTRHLALPGREIVSSPHVYGGIYHYFANLVPAMGASVRFIDDPNSETSWRSAVSDKTAFLFLETPANPTSFVFDIALAANIAHKAGVPLVVDNTVATYAIQRPLKHGADIVVLSLTKGMSGISEGLGGAIVGKTDFITALRDGWGAAVRPVMDPVRAHAMTQCLATLDQRMLAVSANAEKIARWLARRPEVTRVHYPSLAPKRYHTIAEEQMHGVYGLLLSFEIIGGQKAAWRWLGGAERLIHAPHLGHSRTLAIHPATTTHWRVPSDVQMKLGIAPSLIRLSAGCEDDNELALLFEEFERLFARLK